MMAYGLAGISLFFTTLGQLLQKLGVERHKASDNPSKLALLLSREILLGIVCLGLGAASWLLVLAQMEVSQAFPLLSLNFILVLLVSRFYFQENVPWIRWLGVLCIMSGVVLLNL